MSAPRPYQVHIKRPAEREMDALPREVFDRVADAILLLEAAPRRPGSRKLTGTQSYRYRVGKYRIVYTIDDASHSIEIVAVGPRRDVYRRLARD